MKTLIFSLIIIGTVLFAGLFSTKRNNGKPVNIWADSSGNFAVLELFTSEGCSSCPPADELLPKLETKFPGTISLAFHVDYWNRLGWTDPFSNEDFTRRQEEYAREFRLESIYTPQLVVNGEYQLVGSNKQQAEASIKKALLKKPEVELMISITRTENRTIQMTVNTKGEINNSKIQAAIIQKKATQYIKAGENKGATLTHTNIVRVLKSIKAEENISLEMQLPKDLSADNWELIVYAQQKDRKITGAAIYDPSRNKL